MATRSTRLQAKRSLAVCRFIPQQNRRSRKSHTIQLPNGCTHIFHMRVCQLVRHTHTSRGQVVQFCFDLWKVAGVQISAHH